VPKIVATMKWPTLTFSLVAPVCSSFPKCRRSVFRQIDLSRQSRTTKQICPFGILRLALRPHRIAWRSAEGTHSARGTSTATDVGRASQKGVGWLCNLFGGGRR
jgi:hypothetical protein